MKNTSKKKKNGNKNNVKQIGGFTLIELLATIAILSIVISIVIYTAIAVINNSKKKSYQVTINNIQNVASNYLMEDINTKKWINLGNYEYQCVTVQDLIDTGYFKSDVLESMINENETVKATDAVYVERDSTTKAIHMNILLVGDRAVYHGLCQNISVGGEINFDISPAGWSQKKTLDIRYNIYNYDDISKYEYKYNYVLENLEKDDDASGSGNFNISSIKKTVVIDENGTMNANIETTDGNDIVNNSIVINGIDNTGPLVDDNIGDKVVRGKITIPLVISDNQSGLSDEDELILSELEVYIGNNKLTSGVSLEKNDKSNYDLTIKNYNYAGNVKIKVKSDSVFDNVGNGNEETMIETSVEFTNEYTIEYKGNGGKWNNTDTRTDTATYGEEYDVRDNFFVYDGHTFLGWTTKSDGKDDGYNWTGWNGKWEYTDGEYGINNGKLTLYARWKTNKVTINYNVNGGVITGSTTSSSGKTYNWTSESDGTILRDGILHKTTINYGSSTDEDGLDNYNNSKYVEIKKTGYSAVKDAEWKCKFGCLTTGKTFDQSEVYSASDFCDASKGDCTVELEVNWIRSVYNVYLNSFGGSVSPSSITPTYGGTYGDLPTPTKKGYTFKGWFDVSNVGNISIPSSSNNYAYETVLTGIKPGVTYSVQIDSAVLNSGTATNYSLLIFDFTTNTWITGLHNGVFGKSSVTHTLVSPTTVDPSHDVRIIIYAGVSGSTSGNAVTYSGIDVGTKGTTTSSNIQGTSTVNYAGDHQLFAGWTINKVKVYYNVNGGTVTSSTNGGTYTWSTESDGTILRNGVLLSNAINYGASMSSSGLNNYDNANALEIKKTGYIGKEDAEWICLSGCTTANKTFNDTVVYTASDFCDASNGDCSVEVGVNWIPKTYTINYSCGSGTGTAPSSQTVTYNSTFTVASNTGCSKAGYTFSGWYDPTDVSWTNWSGKWAYDNGQYGISGNSLTLTAKWNINKVTINYNVNGGVITSSTTTDSGNTYNWTSESDGTILRNGVLHKTTINYGSNTTSSGLDNYNNSKYVEITKSGYIAQSGAEWKCLSGCSTANKTFDQSEVYSASDFCDTSTGNCTVELGVNWQVASKCYYIKPSMAEGGLSCNLKPDLSTGVGNRSLAVIKKGNYITVSGDPVLAHYGTEYWYYVIDSTSDPSRTTWNCYVVANPGSTEEYTDLGGACPEPDDSTTSSPSTGNSGSSVSCPSQTPRKLVSNGKTYCCVLGTSDVNYGTGNCLLMG